MEIVKFLEGKYRLVRHVGHLKPLETSSLASQLSEWRKKMQPSDPPQYLVLSAQERLVVETALRKLTNRGDGPDLGRFGALTDQMLGYLAKEVGWSYVVIPYGEITIELDIEIQSDSMAFRPIP